MTNELHLDILGASFSITVDADGEYLKNVMEQFRAAIANTQKISGISDPLNVAVLTGFLLCDEINKLKLQLEEKNGYNEAGWEEQEVEDRTLRIISKLEQALNLFGDDKHL